MSFSDEVASDARAKVAEFVTGVRERAESVRTSSLDDLWREATDYVKENPGKAVLASVAVGVLIGSLLRRK